MSRVMSAFFLVATAAQPATADDWPQWRGPDRSGVSKETGLLKEWPKDGPPLRWKASKIGTGYSSPTVVKGRVYLQTTRDAQELALALDEKTGKQIWTIPIGKVGKNQAPQYPGTRSTPTVEGDRLYCLASDGELTCLDTAGKVLWQKNLARDLDGKPGPWAYSESVLVDGDLVVCTPGGEKATLAAIDKRNGAVIWKLPIPGGDIADYASIMPLEVGQQKQYVQFLRKGLVGVDAKTGKFLWRYERTVDPAVNVLTPIVLGNRVFSSSYSGSGLVEVVAEGDRIRAKELSFSRGPGPWLGGAVLVEGYLYGSAGQTLFCAEFATGKEKWRDRSVGPASVCSADGRLYARGHDSGEVALVEPTSEGCREKGRFKQPERSKIQAWPHPVVANGGLYLRDQDVLFCYDVADPKAGKRE